MLLVLEDVCLNYVWVLLINAVHILSIALEYPIVSKVFR